MTEVLYPIFYGTRLVDMATVEATFKPNCHPATWPRIKNFLIHHGGKFGIGGGYRPPGTQPNRPGFAPPGESFHEGQQFPSGRYYTAFDMVVVDPGYRHRAPTWDEVPKQGGQLSFDYGIHANVGKPGEKGAESWHFQPIELDGYRLWVSAGKPDLRLDYPFVVSTPRPTPPQPPVPSTPPPVTARFVMQVNSRTLKRGSVGKDVKFFQRQLNEIAGQGLLLDGFYGEKTEKAVLNWQLFFKKTSDGKPLGTDSILGPNTQQSVMEVSLIAS
jgi:Putative peptidoglycan binding domain